MAPRQNDKSFVARIANHGGLLDLPISQMDLLVSFYKYADSEFWIL